jgi:hypothetical protein
MKKSKKITPAPKPPPLFKVSVASLVPLAEFGSVQRFILKPSNKNDAPRVMGYHCVAAWSIQHSPESQEKFALVCASVGNVVDLFHGTATQNIKDIAKEGLRPGRKTCMFGRGIYLGDINKAFGFARGSNARYVVKVRAALGKVCEAEKSHRYTQGWLNQHGFDSVAGVAGKTLSWGGKLFHTENVVYSPDQVLALKVYEYQQTLETGVIRQGSCDVMVDKKNTPLPPGSTAFRDILTRGVCGKMSYTRLSTDDGGSVWVCEGCIARLRLKIGSRIEVKRARGNRFVHVTGRA